MVLDKREVFRKALTIFQILILKIFVTFTNAYVIDINDLFSARYQTYSALYNYLCYDYPGFKALV